MSDLPRCKPTAQRTIMEVEQGLAELQKTWESIGYPEEMQNTYYEQAHNHIKELVNDMVTESHNKKQMLLDSIKELLQQTTMLHAELHMHMPPKTYEDVPLYKVQQILRADVQTLEQLMKERLSVLRELLAKEQDICRKLGAKCLGFSPDMLPTEQELESFKLYLQKQENERLRLEGIFMDMRCLIVKMMNDLNVVPSSSFENLVYDNPEDFILSSSNMTKLRELRDQIKARVEENKSRVEKMKEELLVLWKCLDEPAEVYQSFLNRYPGYSTASVSAFSAEIKRCKEKRKENISKYVMQMRYELISLWDLCHYCEVERNSFAPFHSTTFTEDLLTLHELEIERLRKFYNDNHTIFELLQQRDNLLNKAKELLQRANNPDRYHNRGGQLLMEEKERKVIQKKLPKIEAELRQLMSEYESAHGQMFTINGMSLDDILVETWETVALEKEKARREAKDKSVKKSPLNSSKKTPGMSHLSVYRSGSAVSSKRKLFTPSPNTSAKRRNKNGDKNKTIVIASKARRSGRIPKIVVRTSKGERRSKGSSSAANNSITDTTYNQFQGHMTGREELHSSLLPEQVLKTANKINVKTPVRTPAKPLRKNLPSATTTPTYIHGSARKAPHSPRIVNSARLAAAPNNLPIIF